jgi:hypothetical protein
MSFEVHPLRCLGWATVRQRGLGRGRREEEERWEESFYTPTYLPKMDGSFALAIFIFQGHGFSLGSIKVNWKFHGK